MALQINFNTQYGVTAPEAYARIERFRGDKNQISVEIQVFFDAAARETAQPIGGIYTELDLENGATMTEMYDALKLLPEFTNSIDV